MKLSDFLDKIEIERSNVVGDSRIMTGTYDSRKVSKNCLFFDFNDGKFVADAVKNGACAIISEKYLESIPCVQVENVRKAYCEFCAMLFGHPEKKLKFIAVVGTNGKTSTVKIIDHILKNSGYKTANIGTLGAEIDGVSYSTGMTTPDTDVFYKLLYNAVLCNVDYVIIELSAHAIYLKKLSNIIFDYCVFTNLSEDHLDYFSDMKQYADVKKSVFLDDSIKCAVINVDDSLGLDIIAKRNARTITYGLNNPADTFAIQCKFDTGINCVVNCSDSISELITPLCGQFNLYNILAAISVCVDIGISAMTACSLLSVIPEIDGRYNVLYGKAMVIIDYAHTPDGLEKVLLTAKQNAKRSLFVVFGCGGNRDKQKRSIMGEIATRIADYAVITSDNPRFESPEEIIADIVSGAKQNGNNYIAIVDRGDAIAFALSMAKQGDTVVVAGKGAEDYIEICGEKKPFSDKDFCEEILGRRQ